VTKWAVGQEVVALLSGGGYAEYVTVPEGQCATRPSTVGFEGSAALIEISATVVSNFDHVNLAQGETVLIHGGAGGIGSLAIPYAASLGCRVVTTVGSAPKAEYARSLGAQVVVDYHGDWEAELKEATGGVDVILDIIGAKYLEANVRLLKRKGRMVTIGLQGGTKGTLNLGLLLNKAATLTATSLRYRPATEKAHIVDEVVARVWPLFESGAIPLPPITYFPMSQASKAHAFLESGENVGKIVLVAQ
jgi:NADPH:quinone reductase-like Zn-dependent oxidoreductase